MSDLVLVKYDGNGQPVYRERTEAEKRAALKVINSPLPHALGGVIRRRPRR